ALDEAGGALRARVVVGRSRRRAGVGVARPSAAAAADAVRVEEAQVEPDRRVERAVLVHEHERELRLERVGVAARREVAGALAELADRVRDATNDLTRARLLSRRLSVQVALREVLR